LRDWLRTWRQVEPELQSEKMQLAAREANRLSDHRLSSKSSDRLSERKSQRERKNPVRLSPSPTLKEDDTNGQEMSQDSTVALPAPAAVRPYHQLQPRHKGRFAGAAVPLGSSSQSAKVTFAPAAVPALPVQQAMTNKRSVSRVRGMHAVAKSEQLVAASLQKSSAAASSSTISPAKRVRPPGKKSPVIVTKAKKGKSVLLARIEKMRTSQKASQKKSPSRAQKDQKGDVTEDNVPIVKQSRVHSSTTAQARPPCVDNDSLANFNDSVSPRRFMHHRAAAASTPSCAVDDDSDEEYAIPPHSRVQQASTQDRHARSKAPSASPARAPTTLPASISRSPPRVSKRRGAVISQSEDKSSDDSDEDVALPTDRLSKRVTASAAHSALAPISQAPERKSRRAAAAAATARLADDGMNGDHDELIRRASPSSPRSPPRRSNSRNRSESKSKKNQRKRLASSIDSATPIAKKEKNEEPSKANCTQRASSRLAPYSSTILPRSKLSRIAAVVSKKSPSSSDSKQDQMIRPKRMNREVNKIVGEAAQKAQIKTEATITKKKIARPLKKKDMTEEEVAQMVMNKVCPSIDRSSGDHWDGTEAHRQRLEAEVKDEGTMEDYRHIYKKNFEKELVKEFEKRSMPVQKTLADRLFWRMQLNMDTPNSLTHPSKSCAKLWTRKKGDPWPVEEFKSVLRFIQIGALCEPCINPFKFTTGQLKGKNCTCPKPLSPKWKAVKVAPSMQLANGQTKEMKRCELWDAQFTTALKTIKEGVKRRLISEIGEAEFKKKYPFHNVALSKRQDQFGKDVFAEAKELNKVRRAANQCPSFILCWTKDTSGSINMPQEWIEDQKSVLSDGSRDHLRVLRKNQRKLTETSCSKDCLTQGHRCCEKSFRCTMTLNKDNLLQSQEGLFPCGIEGRGIPRMSWEKDMSVCACDEFCKCGKKCPKRTVQRGPQKMIILFRTDDRGWSIRTAERLARGEYIFSFAGVIMNQEEVKKTKQNSAMFFDLSPPKGGYTGVGTKPVLTITTCLKANEFKYINHSCCPNAIVARVYSRKWGEALHSIALFARQTLEEYSEIVYDYYHPLNVFPFACKCKSYACRGC
ncbi:hypothetical protein PENTCL1PPCAC_28007, partial [Pristionchus entomophagus]